MALEAENNTKTAFMNSLDDYGNPNSFNLDKILDYDTEEDLKKLIDVDENKEIKKEIKKKVVKSNVINA